MADPSELEQPSKRKKTGEVSSENEGGLPDFDASDRVPTVTDRVRYSMADPSELEQPSEKKKTGEVSSKNEGLLDDSSSDDEEWWSGSIIDKIGEVKSDLLARRDLPSSEREDGVDDRWIDDKVEMLDYFSDYLGLLNDLIGDLHFVMSSENDSHELGQRALPFSGKESNEINGVEGSSEVRSVAGKCPVRGPNAVQLPSASSNNSNCLYVNLRMEGRHPPPLLLWMRDMLSQPIHSPPAGIIFGNLKPENVLMTDSLFIDQLSYSKKNTMDLKFTPEGRDLFSRLREKNPELRLEAREVILHPYSWSSEVKLLFIQEMSARLHEKNPEGHPDPGKELKRSEAFYKKWIDKLDPDFKDYILQSEKKYKFSSVTELVRLMRNKSVHFNEFPSNIKDLLRDDGEGFYNYFASRFPSLFMTLYGAAFRCCREEEWFIIFHNKIFRRYFGSAAI